MKNSLSMKRPTASFNAAALVLLCASAAFAQSGATRPRRVTPTQPPPDAVANTTPSPAATAGPAQGSTAQAFPLLQQNQYDAALRDASTLYYRGITEMNLKKTADAERTFNDVIKLDPKNKGALVYLGQMAFTRSDYTTSINMLNRATLADPTYPRAWELLTQAYMYRGRNATGTAADADFLAAVRASDSLARIRNDDQTAILQGQALFFAKQYDRAAAVL